MDKVMAGNYDIMDKKSFSFNGGTDDFDALNFDITLESVLGLYGDLGSDSLESLRSTRKKPVELKRNQKMLSLCDGRADMFLSGYAKVIE